MKHFKLLLLLLIPLLFITDVKADTIKRYYIQDTDGTKSTWWNAYPTSGYDYTYTNQYIVVDYVDSPEKYVVLSTCLTGDLDMQITSNLQGNIEYLEYQTGASCQIENQTWVGRMFYYIFKVNEYYDPNAQNELYVSFDLKVANYNTYLVYQDIFRVETYSNYPNLGTNDKEFEDIKDGLDNIDSSINETNDKLDETNDNLNDIKDSITSEEAPDISALDGSAGWLPAGPIDSILNLPLSLFNSLLTAMDGVCQPLNLIIPFVDYNFELPCVSSLYAKISGASEIIDFVGLVIGVLILYYYFIHLYNWVDARLTMQYNDDWGGV